MSGPSSTAADATAIRTPFASNPALGVMNALMFWRARGLMARVVPLLRRRATILDVGCGTGHNAERLRRLGLGPVSQVDIVDFTVVGPRPALFDGGALPFWDAQFDAVTLVYVLHYTRDPVALLKEARRVCRSTLIVMQTVCEGSTGPRFHRLNEFISRLAFYAARRLGAIHPVPCPLNSGCYFSRARFLQVAQQAGLVPSWLQVERHFPLLPLLRITCKLEPLKVPGR